MSLHTSRLKSERQRCYYGTRVYDSWHLNKSTGKKTEQCQSTINCLKQILNYEMTEIHTKYIFIWYDANGKENVLLCKWIILYIPNSICWRLNGTDEGDIGYIEHCNEIVILLYKIWRNTCRCRINVSYLTSGGDDNRSRHCKEALWDRRSQIMAYNEYFISKQVLGFCYDTNLYAIHYMAYAHVIVVSSEMLDLSKYILWILKSSLVNEIYE